MNSHSYWVRITSRDHSVASEELSVARSRMSLAEDQQQRIKLYGLKAVDNLHTGELSCSWDSESLSMRYVTKIVSSRLSSIRAKITMQ
ncbi:hypothetical protein EYF80_037078 [Liparis tanakae]|uniref:Uncharacterized protein n=1 Tax=Liparis tanakae TaxID=230148 RepID=A0A4Z2GGM8_9TELE|nr:hypothetical protein EYF80_037078 [Liparis tanakae]